MIDFVCNSCGLIYHADEAHEGKAIRCSQCGTVLPITRAITPEVTRASTASVKMVEEEPKARAILLWQLSWRRRKGMLAIFAAVLAVGVVWLMVSRSPNTEPTRKPENNPVTVSANELEKQPATDSTPPRPAIPEPSNALKNGTRLSKDIGTHGKGILVLRNGNGDDAVVRVIEQHSDTTVRWVYIAAHSDLKLTHIEPGSYLLLFSTGIDWDDENGLFRQNALYYQTDRNIAFEEKQLSDAVEYGMHTVTLHHVLGGNFPSHHIGEAEFTRGYHSRIK